MRKSTNYIEIEKACNSPYVTTEDIMIILGGVSRSKADSFRTKLELKLDDEKMQAERETDEKIRNNLLANCFYFKDTRPHRLPVKRVLEGAHLDLEVIRREANKMRKALKIERNNQNEKEVEIKTIS